MLLGTVAITTVAAILRFVNLSNPQSLVFDETYYVKDAYTLGLFGHEKQWPDNANSDFESGILEGYLQEGAYVVHPPLGKWIIWLGMQLFGAGSTFGWRFAVALLGTIAVPLIILIARKLIGNRVFALLAGLFLAIEGQSIVLARTAILDGILAFLVLLGFYLLVLDKQEFARLLNKSALGSQDFAIRFRPYLLLAGLVLGLATSVKWSGLYFLAGFGLWTFVSDLLVRQRLGLKIWPTLPQGFINAPTLLIPAFGAYLASWSGWIRTSGGWGRQVPDNWLQELWEYHKNAYGFHTGLSSEHPYAANAWQWLLNLRPTAFYYESFEGEVCGALSECTVAITPVPHPLIWYSAVLAMIWLVSKVVRKVDLNAGMIMVGFLAGWAPWLAYLSRTTFQFYSVVFTPFLILALAYGLHSFWRHGLISHRRQQREWAIALFVVVALALAVVFASLWMGLPVPYWYWRVQMWLPSWI